MVCRVRSQPDSSLAGFQPAMATDMGSPAAETAEVTESAIVPVPYDRLVTMYRNDTAANTVQDWKLANVALKWVRDRSEGDSDQKFNPPTKVIDLTHTDPYKIAEIYKSRKGIHYDFVRGHTGEYVVTTNFSWKNFYHFFIYF